MESMTESRDEKRIRGEQELLDMHLSDVLPSDIEVDRSQVSELVVGYIKEFQWLYSQHHGSVNSMHSLKYDLSIGALRERAASELKLLDTLIPIAGTVQELIPWDVDEHEAVFYESGVSKGRLTWVRFVQAMGKRMSSSYPNIED